MSWLHQITHCKSALIYNGESGEITTFFTFEQCHFANSQYFSQKLILRGAQVLYFHFLWAESLETVPIKFGTWKYPSCPPSVWFSDNHLHMRTTWLSRMCCFRDACQWCIRMDEYHCVNMGNVHHHAPGALCKTTKDYQYFFKAAVTWDVEFKIVGRMPDRHTLYS